MEISRIHILESFPLVSIVMPYYGATHKMFLLLSEFSKQTRLILIDYYNEFRRHMFDYNQKRWITIKDLSKLCIPWDLFKFIIEDYWLANEGVKDLISLTNTDFN